MKKEKMAPLVIVSILILFISTMFSFLLYLGPMFVSICLATIAGEPKYKWCEKPLRKVYFLTLGIIGLVLCQAIILDVSGLTLILNILVFILLFIGMLLPNRKPTAVE